MKHVKPKDAGNCAESDMEAIAPLLNFESELDSLQVGELHLTKLTDQDRRGLNDMLAFIGSRYGIPTQLTAKFKLSRSYPKQADEPHSIPKSVVLAARQAIWALRLLKPGSVGTDYMFEITARPDGATMLLAAPLQDCGSPSFGGYAYRLLGKEAGTLAILLDRLKAAQERQQASGLDIALSRFNQSYSRSRGEDRIIDLTIALESSLLADLGDEYKYRLALRGAALSQLDADPVQTSSFLKTLYDVRSKIVHSGKTLQDREIVRMLAKLEPPSTSAMFPEQCEAMVRKIIVTYLEETGANQTVKEINEKLENQILQGLKAEE